MGNDDSHPTGKIKYYEKQLGGALTTVTGPRGHVLIRSYGRGSQFYVSWGGNRTSTIGTTHTRSEAIAMACGYAGIEV